MAERPDPAPAPAPPQDWYTAGELAALALPGLPASAKAISRP